MPRPKKIWFRKDVGCWMVTISGKRIRLAEGRENKKLAQQKFHELAVERARAPEAPTARVADVIEAFTSRSSSNCWIGAAGSAAACARPPMN
jgi:hypothetical protein